MPTCAFTHRACSLNCILGQTFQQRMCALCISALTGAWLTSGRGSPETLDLELASLKLHLFRHRWASMIRGLRLLRTWWMRTLNQWPPPTGTLKPMWACCIYCLLLWWSWQYFPFCGLGGHILIFLLVRNRLKTWWWKTLGSSCLYKQFWLLEEHSVWSCEVAKQAEILQKAGSLWEQVPHNRDVVCIVWSKWSNI